MVEMDVECINCGSSHSLALVRGKNDAESVVVSWGRGEDGQLGHGDPEEADRPKAVFALFGKAISDVHCGAEYSVAVSAQRREVYSWGWGDFGRLGHADSADVFVPTPIASLSGRKVSAVACGDTHTLVILEGGRLVSFGRNQNGQLGNASTNDCYEPQEVRVVGGEFVMRVACGAEHSACCTRDGKVYSWGWGRYGNIGDGDTVDRHEPVRVKGLDGVKIEAIACGWRHTMVIDDTGSMYTWGWSKYGQLGHGDHVDQPTPKQVESLKGRRMTLLAGGWRHSLACDDGGTLHSWGWNKFGQLGLGHNEDVNLPAAVKMPDGVRLVTSGWRHSLAVTSSGRLYAWGRGVNGQLGVGDTEDQNLPVEIRELGVDASIEKLKSVAHPISMAAIPAGERFAIVPSAPADGDAAVPEDDPHHRKRSRSH